VLGGSVVAGRLTGTVLVKVKGSSRFVPLTDATPVPVGSVFDTRAGKVELRTAIKGRGLTQSGTFWGAVFEVRQSRSGRGMTDIILRGAGVRPCGGSKARRRLRLANAARSKGLWGKDKRGRFRTHGKNSVATVRGTTWLTVERCDGTLTRVVEGKVVVRDRHRRRSVVVTAGHSYLSRAPR
jgi:hypothetical protein